MSVTVQVRCGHCLRWVTVPADRFMLQINPVDGRLEYECVCTRCAETTGGIIPRSRLDDVGQWSAADRPMSWRLTCE